MRTHRVEATPSSIFRNSKQYLHTNELFYRALEDGGRQGQHGNQRKERGKNKQRTNQKSKRVLKNSASKVIVKGLQFEGDHAAAICNNLLLHSSKITAARNKVARLRTYRTSI